MSCAREPPWGKGEDEQSKNHEEEEEEERQAVRDFWDDSTEDDQEGAKICKPPRGKTNVLSSSAEQLTRQEKQSPVTRMSKSDKAITKALIKISCLVGDNNELQKQVDTILTEQVKFKSIIMQQHEELAFLEGRILELERHQNEENKQKPTEDDHPQEVRKPTYALVVSSETMDQQQVSTLMKKKINPTELGLQDVVMRPAKQRVIITTTSKEASGPLETQLQQRIRNVQVKRPKENKYPYQAHWSG
ncbi:hypothetical protein HPB48_016963 [Haemaphysalis longicornis]|uniref:Uncharacterized protein n=1 Tax=Haemaphysalis longicornis TaxID=44386 RepID=A0A9J6GAA1_HAELO|nr:hypothetical protein HPB48_016963 [Haemaphysalis longicornis]